MRRNQFAIFWNEAMKKLLEVESARALMTEAMTWSVMKWLREKKRVRKTADQANAALDQLSEKLRQDWPEPVRTVYEALVASTAGTTHLQKNPQQPAISRDASLLAKKLKDCDEEAYRARMDAEETFDKAEKQLSTRLAREGCQKAILSWDLHEKAIRKAEAVTCPK